MKIKESKMKPEIKQKWCSALRSGEYQQGRGRLRDRSNGFCCLGVLSDLYIKEKGETWDLLEEENIYTVHGEPNYLTSDVAEWAELDHQFYNPANVATKNDEGWTFDRIADFIEENL
jgi:hypothetical protein